MDNKEVAVDTIKIAIEELYEALRLLEAIADDEYEIELEEDDGISNDNWSMYERNRYSK